VKIRFKNGFYFIRYYIGFKKIEFPISKELMKEKVLVKRLDNLYRIEFEKNERNEKAVLKLQELNHLLKQKIIHELVSGGVMGYLIYIILGIGVGFAIGYMVNDYNYKTLIQQLINRTIIVPTGG
jgi:hypothetical protein